MGKAWENDQAWLAGKSPQKRTVRWENQRTMNYSQIPLPCLIIRGITTGFVWRI
jgi:hypothetical protein